MLRSDLPKSRFFCLVICLFVFAVNSFAQSEAQPQSQATISGKVRWRGKGVADCPIYIWTGFSSDIPQYSIPIKTDRDGNFQRSVPPGNYMLAVTAGAFYVVVDGKVSLQPKPLTVDPGDVIDNITIDLERGGVVTGKVTLDNKPVIDLKVSLLPTKPIEKTFRSMTPTFDKAATDDRGIYRFYGVPPGEYKVVAGEQTALSGMRGRLALTRTFFPDLTEEAKAKTIVVDSAKELNDIDIRMSPPVPLFTIRGLVVDEESGAPVYNVRVGLRMYLDNKPTGGRSGNDFSNDRGQFLIENVPPGRYALFTSSQFNAGDDHFGQSEQFDVTDHDIEGFVFKTKVGASAAGVVVIEGQPDATNFSQLKNIFVTSIPKVGGTMSTKPLLPRADGSFVVRGLTEGILDFQFGILSDGAQSQLTIARVEYQGRTEPIAVRAGQNLTGIKLVLAEATASLRGRIEFADRPSYPEMSGSAALYLDKQIVGWGDIDPSGNFLIDHVSPGSYRLVVNVRLPGSTPQSTHSEQTIELTSHQVSPVTIWLNPQPIKPAGTKPNPL